MYFFSYQAPGQGAVGRGPFRTKEEAEKMRAEHLKMGHKVTEIAGEIGRLAKANG